MKEYQVWDCKIGIRGEVNLPSGADLPMREAVERAFFDLTGIHAEFCFSGWGSKLSEIERDIVEDKEGMISRAVGNAK